MFQEFKIFSSYSFDPDIDPQSNGCAVLCGGDNRVGEAHHQRLHAN
jgi:hypothetical protein